ncbi:ATP-binding protein [Chitinophaga sp. GCM10012297]|uniref:histidine kinase n=1 Tax=Chitinophaga chungangae TaxID=2821488 RepID=A0ABS3YEE5_9BACT|nr:sensor histidine kinase [Chitinophaga chungangae]MBO9153033.1 CHASE3 domain-containing protein [Chitinophaga chungangae]
MHISVHKKIRVGFFIAFTIIVVASLVSYVIARNLMHNADRLSHAVEVSKRLDAITRYLKDAEAAIRGYSLTKEEAFLNPSMEERSIKIENEYRKLRRIIDDPAQQRNLDTLKRLLDVKYTQLTGQRKGSSSAAIQQAEVSMDRIDHKVEDMILIEQAQLNEKTRMFHFFSGLSIPVLFIISIAAILIGVYSYITLTREFRLQLHIEARMKNYQRELQENIALLNNTNKELEQFAYVASHDLQEPLRKISTFSDRLLSKHRHELPEEAGQLIDRMVAAVGRMRILINDLLSFSRAGRITPESLVPIDLNTILQDVIGDLEPALQEKKGSILFDQLPVIEGSDTGFHQLFQNLLSNSIKFAHPERPLEIRIRRELLTGKEAGFTSEKKWGETYCRISIQDNGIGFDQVYADRIFLIFQRLHGVSEYKGTGIGLAICKKIVDSHNGTITAVGAAGQGSTFVIVLPVKQIRED